MMMTDWELIEEIQTHLLDLKARFVLMEVEPPEEPLDLIEEIRLDLLAIRRHVALPESPYRDSVIDQVREIAIEAKQWGKTRSWAVERCDNELGLDRVKAQRMIYEIWPEEIDAE